MSLSVKDTAEAAVDNGFNLIQSIQNLDVRDLIIAVALIVGGIILGIIFEILIIKGLHRLTRNTKWEWDDILIRALKRAPLLWFTVAGLYAALTFSLNLDPRLQSLIKSIIITLLLLSGTIIVARAASGFVRLYSKKTKGGLPSTSLFSNLTSLIILVAGFVIILQNLGVSITPLITALGIGGLAVALALQDTLSNLFAGFQIIVSRQVRQGDFIALDTGEEGYVTDVKWRNTTIRSLRSTKVFIVPNGKVASAIVTSFNMPRRLIWKRVYVGVHYESDLEHVEKVTMEVAQQVVKDFYPDNFPHKPVVRFREFADSSINLSARLPIREYIDQFAIRSEFIKKLHRRYEEEGIEIPYPMRNVYMRTIGDTQKPEESS